MDNLSKRLGRAALVLSGFLTAGPVVAGEAQSTKAAGGNEPLMKVLSVAEQPSVPGPAANFTGTVRVKMLVKGEPPSSLGCGWVEFQPGARSNWHTHPRGQLLIVTEGSGLVQEWGKPIKRIKPGMVVWTPPGVKHWHGASPDTAMTHAAVTEALDGKSVDWMERVTDQQYDERAQ